MSIDQTELHFIQILKSFIEIQQFKLLHVCFQYKILREIIFFLKMGDLT